MTDMVMVVGFGGRVERWMDGVTVLFTWIEDARMATAWRVDEGEV